jgi:hypothetical protein
MGSNRQREIDGDRSAIHARRFLVDGVGQERRGLPGVGIHQRYLAMAMA